MAHVWDERVNRAAEVMADPQAADRSVTEIAFACAFTDSTHFSRLLAARKASHLLGGENRWYSLSLVEMPLSATRRTSVSRVNGVLPVSMAAATNPGRSPAHQLDTANSIRQRLGWGVFDNESANMNLQSPQKVTGLTESREHQDLHSGRRRWSSSAACGSACVGCQCGANVANSARIWTYLW